ncbi:DUF2147 domain-containing protein [Paraflavisolibacter sp. H34]|uniref:DUF2147 domain-containing protein n=1 Tax=Huijunlia imazamoxiresistens TaxID=3127457 RepID=UPI00301B4EB2
MKKLIALLLVSIAFMAPLFAQNADAVLGTWLSEEKDAKILIYKTGDKYFGKLVWLKTPYEADGKTPKTDKKNGSAALRSRPLQNLVILTNFSYDDGAWEDGKIYDPESGKTYSSTMKIEGNNLRLRGYIGISAFGRTAVWTKSN